MAIREAAGNTFDFGEAAKRALGKHWQGLSEQDRQEFTGLFADLLERGYVARIEEYSGEKILYTGDNVEADTATVKTQVHDQEAARRSPLTTACSARAIAGSSTTCRSRV